MNVEAVATETFQILRSFDYEVLLYGEDGNQVYEPVDARRFFAKPENLLVSLVEDGEDSCVRLYLSKSTDVETVLGLITTLRTMATKYNLIFHVRKHGRVLSPKDFATHASVTEQYKRQDMNLLEGMYGTSRSSYLKMENARMIVRHSAPINENVLGSRGRNIDAIYIENAVGERHLFPTTQLAPARAMTHHVNQGGNWADAIGEQITRMANDFANLGMANRHIRNFSGQLPEAAQDLRGKICETLGDMRRTFESMCRKTRYKAMAEHLAEMATTLNEASCDYADKVQELAQTLNTENVALSETVLESIAKAVDNRYKAPPPKTDLTVMVLGNRLSQEAWDKFKAGHIDLVGKPDVKHNLEFTSPLAKLSYYTSAIAEKCADDTIGNLLGFVADALSGDDRDLMVKARRVAIAAMMATGLLKASDGVAQTPAVREFIEWMSGFDTKHVLVEGAYPNIGSFDYTDGRVEGRINHAVDAVIDEFDPEAFLRSRHGNDFVADADEPYTKDDILPSLESYLARELASWHEMDGVDMSSAAEYLYPTLADTMRKHGYPVALEEDCECTHEAAMDECDWNKTTESVAAEGWTRIEGPIQDVTGDAAHDLEDQYGFEPKAEKQPGADEWDRDTLIYWNADKTMKMVMTPNHDFRNGYHYTISVYRKDGAVEENAELSREDILLPKNQNDDLIDEVTPATVEDPKTGEHVTPDDGYIGRLRSLAGIRR